MDQNLQRDDPGVVLNCPWCGLALEYVGSAHVGGGDIETVHVYDCTINGRLYLMPEWGFSRRRPTGWISRPPLP